MNDPGAVGCEGQIDRLHWAGLRLLANRKKLSHEEQISDRLSQCLSWKLCMRVVSISRVARMCGPLQILLPSGW
jgi:hypothetical protein